MPWADETTADVSDAPLTPRGRWRRHTGIGVLALIVVAAGLDLLGPRTGDTAAATKGYALTLEYPQIARAGEPAPLHLTVDSDAGFGDVVQVRFCDTWFDHLDFQSWYPNPSAETALPGSVVYEFDPPPTGTVLEISLDARIAPGQLGGRDGCEVSLLVDDEPVVSAAFTTWRVP